MKTAKGIILVGIGASSYGMLATFVKIANNHQAHTALLTFAQFLVGALVLSAICYIRSPEEKTSQLKASYPRLKLLAYGTSLGFTSTFYYLSIRYIPVSVSVILLMQAIWIGIILESVRRRKWVDKSKIYGGLIVIIGTLLATDVFSSQLQLNGYGLMFGLLAAVSYATTMYASDYIATGLPSLERSKYMVWGGLAAILLCWNISIVHYFSWSDFAQWGLFLAIFGTILPPIFFMKGFPLTGTALGSIAAALEIPVSVFAAYIMLGEKISTIQWLGILIILAAVVLINADLKRWFAGSTVEQDQ